MAVSATVTISSDPDINALIEGSKWVGTITYNFPDQASRYRLNYGLDIFTSFHKATEGLRKAIESAITDEFSAVANISFAYSGNDRNTNAEAAYAMLPGTGSYGFYPDWAVRRGDPSGKMAGDAWFGEDLTDFGRGSQEWMIVLQQLGRTVGLKYANETYEDDDEANGLWPNGPISAARNSIEFTVMTDTWYVGKPDGEDSVPYPGSFAQTLMMYDIAALQHIYGANYAWRAGDTVYRWDESTGAQYVDDVLQGNPYGGSIFMTVWDGGGTDFYDFSAWTTDLTIDLRPGEWTITASSQRADLGILGADGQSGAHLARGNIANALLHGGDTRSLIEVAIGGKADDVIRGNQADNLLIGLGGDDSLTGDKGNDALVGGDGFDVAIYSRSRNEYSIIRGDDGTVTVAHLGGAGNDGVDSLTDIETVRFLDGDLELGNVSASHVALNNEIVKGVEGLARWNKHTLTYYFPTLDDAATVEAELKAGRDLGKFIPLDTDKSNGFYYREAVKIALGRYAHVADLEFVEASSLEAADIKFILNDFSNAPSLAGHAEFPGMNPKQGGSGEFESYVALRAAPYWVALDEAEPGGSSSREELVVHELGHALGLGHPHDTGNGSTQTADKAVDASDDPLDNARYTVMSYEGPWFNSSFGAFYGHTITPMAIDIAALQHMYGARTVAHDGTTTYRLVEPYEKPLLLDGSGGLVEVGSAYYSIWDTGGYDTIEYNGKWNVIINLNDAPLTRTDDADTQAWIAAIQRTELVRDGLLPAHILVDITDGNYHAGGFFSTMFGAPFDPAGGFSIANGVQIEAAYGGGGNDVLIGNELFNTLDGNDGNDLLVGAGGDDGLVGDAGDDTLIGGRGNDSLYGLKGSDTAVFSGRLSEYHLERGTGPGSIVVTHTGGDRSDGRDVLVEVEYARFQDATVDLSAPDLNYLPTDVLFLIDVSDDPADINSSTLRLVADEHIGLLVGGLMLSSDANTRFAVASFSDVPDAPFGGPDDYVYRRDLSFTNDILALDGTIAHLADTFRQTSSNDDPASSQLFSLLFALMDTDLGFRANARKHVVVLSASPAHTAEEYGLDAKAVRDFLAGVEVFGGAAPIPAGFPADGTINGPGTVSGDEVVPFPDWQNPPMDNLPADPNGPDPLVANLGSALGSAGAVPMFAVGAQAAFYAGLAATLGGTTVNLASSGGLVNGLLAGLASLQGDISSLSITPLATQQQEGSAGGLTPLTFTITRAGNVDLAVSVDWAAGVGAAPATSLADFADDTFPGGSVAFAAGETSKIVTVEVVADSSHESPAEHFVVSLYNASVGAAIDPEKSSAVGTIIDDDAPIVSIAASSAMVAEGNSATATLTFTLTRSGDASAVQEVHYQASGSGANPAGASDFSGGTLPGGTVSFAAGETSRTITLTVLGDTEVEADETVVVTLSNPSAGLVIGTASAGATIANDDAAVSVGIGSAVKAEGNGGTTAFTFTLTLSGDLSGGRSVSYSVVGSGIDAAAASDFAGGVLPGGTVTFAAAESSRVITIEVLGDSAVEVDESFAVELSNPSAGLQVGAASAVGTIVGDDASVSIVSQNAEIAEGDSGTTLFTFVVTRTGSLAAAHSVSWSMVGSGVEGADPSDIGGTALNGGTLSFAIGETTKTIEVEVIGDAEIEFDEAFEVSLHNPSAGLNIGTASAVSTIRNDDRSVASVAALSMTKAEENSGTTPFTFTVTLDKAGVTVQTVDWSVTGSPPSAADGADFGGALPSGTVTFAAGETSKTVVLPVSGDMVVEPDDFFSVSLSSPSAGLLLGTTSAVGIIQNDDRAVVSIAALSAALAEGGGGATSFTFTVSLDQASFEGQTASWAVTGAGATAADAADFGGTLPSGVVSFAAGETSKIVTISVTGDASVELDESIAVTLSTVSAGLLVGTASANGTILNDDRSTVSIAAQSAVKAEGNSGLTAGTFIISLSQAGVTAQTVSWAVTGSGTNPAGAADFVGGVLPGGVVTFAAGEISKVVTVNVAGDTTVEADEGYSVTLSGLSAGLVAGVTSAAGTIQNDDIAIAVTAHDDAYVVLRGQSLTATASVLSNDVAEATATLLSGPAHGTLQLAGNGTFTYAAAAGFSGIDSFTYRASNGGSTDDGQVHIHVVPVNTGGGSTTLGLLALTAEEQIASTYAAFFGRGADKGGFGFWVGQFVQNLPTQGPSALFANIASSFGISEEAKALYPFLVSPFTATDNQISAFLDSVYNNLFGRSSDAGGLGYWTDQIKQTLQAGQFVGSILVNIMSGAQDTAAGKDITTLMGKVAVSLAFVREQEEHHTAWAGASDTAAATTLLQAVTADPQTVLVGVRNAEALIAAHA